MFVLCLGSTAFEHARKSKRKGILVKDVQFALKDLKLDLDELNEVVCSPLP